MENPKLINEVNIKGYPETLYMINVVFRKGAAIDESYSELPMTEYMQVEDEKGSSLNVVLLRLFQDESQAVQYKDFVRVNSTTEESVTDIIDYITTKTRTLDIPNLKNRLLENLDSASLSEDETPNKLCIVLCTFDGSNVQEQQIIFQNLNADLNIYPN